jgi:RNA polymerase sigma-70 factor (ECF subfamily)
LTVLLPAEPEVLGLAALVKLHHARRFARCTRDGAPILLDQQDRALWDRALIGQGCELLERGLALGRNGPYLVQAAIAAVHAQAATAAGTDWRHIAGLYDHLVRMTDTPVVRLNRAAAIGMAHGPEAGLAAMDADRLGGQLSGYRWYHSARAELLRRAGRFPEAVDAYRRALELTQSEPERRFLHRRLEEAETT